ncbi:MAG: DegT/DnrJ/EryC1/StrS family aminotransferase [Desulfobacteraceae bacterium]|nr:DegT/DnrJ/EryC1/StrS family aminotransferase [Desulfobacteraceae bacterium]
MKVPFVDLRAQHDELRSEIDSVLTEVIDNSSFIGGPFVDRFERNFAEFLRLQFCVACASGTDALKLALMAAGVGEGDAVVTVPNTFIATVEAITQVGAIPAFVDIDSDTYCMSPEKLAEFLAKDCRTGNSGYLVDRRTGRRVKALLPVHLYGLPADMNAIAELGACHNLEVVEDACQAHGASRMHEGVERRAGSFGGTSAFSFYPGKNLGGMGEGGAVVTDSEHKAERMRIWREHGQVERYIHVSPNGWNGRLDALQCAVLDVKLKKLEEWNERRRKAAKWYEDFLCTDDRVVLPMEPEGSRHVYHLFVVRLPDRDSVRGRLSSKEIGVGLHYPIPLHLQAAYRGLGLKAGDFPEAEKAARSILSLPMFPHITHEQVAYVCESLRDALDDRAHAACCA